MQGLPGFTAETACNSWSYGCRHAVQLLAEVGDEMTSVYPQLGTPLEASGCFQCTLRMIACLEHCPSASPDLRRCFGDCMGSFCLLACGPI